MKKAILVLACIGLMMLTACETKQPGLIDGYAYRESKDGLWSMISPNGEVIFKEEFKNEPSHSVEGRFFVRNAQNLWEIYTTEAKPQKLQGEFLEISPFYDGVAVAVRPNMSIELIDLNAKTLKTLDKIDGGVVDEVIPVGNGLAIYEVDGYRGIINMKGEVVVKAEYCVLSGAKGGLLVGIHKKWESQWKRNKTSSYKLSVIDWDGTKLFEVRADKYQNLSAINGSRYLVAEVKQSDETCCGLLDENGKWVLKPSSKVKQITHVVNENVVYSNGDGYGLMSISGEPLIRVKYDFFLCAGRNDLFLVGDYKDGFVEMKLVNVEDEELSQEKIIGSMLSLSRWKCDFEAIDGKYILVSTGENNYVLMNADGQLLEEHPDIADASDKGFAEVVVSDYLDAQALVASLGITKESLDGMSFAMNAEAIVKYCHEKDSTLETDAEEYKYREYVGIFSK